MNCVVFTLLVVLITVTYTYSVSECPFGSFGRKCKYSCHCMENDACDVTSGVCLHGCSNGWSGPSCQRENIAFGRACEQKEGQSSQNASLATDTDINSCSASKAGVPGWWTLSLDGVQQIEMFTLLTDYLSDFYNWRVYVGVEKDIFGMNLCTTIRIHDNGATFHCQEPVTGRYVTVVNREGPVIICDFQIFQCSPFTFGEMCTKTCNCLDLNERCDMKGGVCTSGCDSGWVGEDCYTECMGSYGPNCASPCGHCKDGSTCDRLIGTCPNGCDPGWTGLLCANTCELGHYGQSCAEICGRCYGDLPCNPLNGVCEKGCKAGWNGTTCKESCRAGFFGENCEHTCGNCLSQQSCGPVDGICKQGCLPGWEGLFCTQDCLPGFYGIGCQQNCIHCFHGLCHKVTGQCRYGCELGRKGINCSEECALDAFGDNCSHKCNGCSKGKGRICDAMTGVCIHGCLPGFNGLNCSEECSDGFYGVNCATKCGVCKAGTICDKRTGHCPEGCALNFYGDFCTQTDTFSDDSGSQLQVFLGTTLGIVGSLMTVVTVCLVLVWKREHLPKIQLDEYTKKKPVQIEDEDGRLLSVDAEV